MPFRKVADQLPPNVEQYVDQLSQLGEGQDVHENPILEGLHDAIADHLNKILPGDLKAVAGHQYGSNIEIFEKGKKDRIYFIMATGHNEKLNLSPDYGFQGYHYGPQLEQVDNKLRRVFKEQNLRVALLDLFRAMEDAFGGQRMSSINNELKKIAQDLVEDDLMMDEDPAEEPTDMDDLAEDPMMTEEPLEEEGLTDEMAPEDPEELAEEDQIAEHEVLLEDAAMAAYDVIVQLPGFEHLEGFKREDFIGDFTEALNKHIRLEGEEAVEVEMGMEPDFMELDEVPLEEPMDLDELDETGPEEVLEDDLMMDEDEML